MSNNQIFTTLDKYQGLIFDLDGTLIDSMPYHLDAWCVTAEEFDFPFDRAWLHSLGGMPGDKIVELLNQRYQLDLSPVEVSEFRMMTFSAFASHGGPIPCTNKVLEHFWGSKKMAVGTGSPRVNALQILEETGILVKLDAVVTATDVDNHKPNPDTFLLAASRIGVEPRQCIVFEDTELGRLAAHSAQMDCVMLEDNQLKFYPYQAAIPRD